MKVDRRFWRHPLVAQIVGGLVVTAVVAWVVYVFSGRTQALPAPSTDEQASGITIGNIAEGARVQIGTSNSSQDDASPSDKSLKITDSPERHSETGAIKSGISDTVTKLRGQQSRTVESFIVGTFERKGLDGKVYQLVFGANGDFKQLVDGELVPGSNRKCTQRLSEGRIDVPGSNWVVVLDEDHLRYEFAEYWRVK
jgi:hypothetical protein